MTEELKKSEVKALVKGEFKGKVSCICDECVEKFKKITCELVPDLVS